MLGCPVGWGWLTEGECNPVQSVLCGTCRTSRHNEWTAARRSKEWCFRNFVHNRAINEAEDIRLELLALLKRCG